MRRVLSAKLTFMTKKMTVEEYIEKAKGLDRMGPVSRRIKRWMDVVVSFLGLVVLSPVFLVVFCVVKLSSPGAAVFKQERVGRWGRNFNIYKFRTMVENAEKEDSPLLYVENDGRLTKVGLFLRAHHLDELPQLWNVLKGDMSLVGPRPERRFFVDQIIKENPDYQLLYYLHPGAFSKATLYNGYTDTMEKMLERLRMDLEYLRTRTLWEELKISIHTLLFIFCGKKF